MPGDLAYEDREVVLRADFHELDDEDCCYVTLRFLQGPRHPRVGETVYLLDGERQGCVAEVVEVHGWSARVRPDWDTWTGNGAVPARTRPALDGAAGALDGAAS